MSGLLPANWADGGAQYHASNQNLVENSGNWAQGGRVYLDSFAGGSDDAKLTAALTYAGAQSLIPTIVLPPRVMTFNTGGRVPFSAMRIVGPPGCDGPKSPELSASFGNHLIILNVGADSSAWFTVGANTIFDVYMGGLVVQNGNNASQFMSSVGGGTLYAAQFDGMTFYGMTHVFGSPANQMGFTQVTLTGHWEVIGGVGCQFVLGGSDNALWMSGYCNLGNGGSVTGDVYNAIFNTFAKTSIGYLYLTCSGGWSGLKLNSSDAFGGCSFHGGTYEGALSAPSTAPPLTITSGDWSFHGGAFNYTTSASNGVIIQTGGRATFHSPSYAPAPSSPVTNWLYQTGGSTVIIAPTMAGATTPHVFWNGTSVSLTYAAINHFP